MFPGDSTELLTVGAIPATLHRVELSGEERWSVVVFVGLDYATAVPRQSVEGFEGYKPVCIGDHIAACICGGHAHLRAQRDSGELDVLQLPPGGNPVARRLRDMAGGAPSVWQEVTKDQSECGKVR